MSLDPLDGVRRLLAAAEAAYAAGTCRPISCYYVAPNDETCRCAAGASVADVPLPAGFGRGSPLPSFAALCIARFSIGLATLHHVEDGFDCGLICNPAPDWPLSEAWHLAYEFGRRMKAEYGEAPYRGYGLRSVPAIGGAA